MIHCRRCGSANSDEQNFCSQCGLSLKENRAGDSGIGFTSKNLDESQILKEQNRLKQKILASIIIITICAVLLIAQLILGLGSKTVISGIRDLPWILAGFIFCLALFNLVRLIKKNKLAVKNRLFSKPSSTTAAQADISSLPAVKIPKPGAQTKMVLWIILGAILIYLLLFGFVIPVVLKAAGLRSNGPAISDLYTAGGLTNLLSGAAGGGSCNLPVRVISCQCSLRSSKGVWCEVDSGKSGCYTDSHGIRMCSSGQGQGWIPLECAKQLGKCR